ncbi:MAG: hypothetical protein EP306_05450 [Burkholderiales bacterium]|nr:MAG: hypothetical protein EP306_05450 [Burkholderiales bacterium]
MNTGNQTPGVRDLLELKQALMDRRGQPVLDLHQALLEMGLMDEDALRALEDEDPQLLHSRSRKLVERLLVSDQDWHRAMARVAGLVEVDALNFEMERHALEIMPLPLARQYGVLPLGMVDELFFVACAKPTSEDLHHQLQTAMGGRSMPMVWASEDAISRRLDLLGTRD